MENKKLSVEQIIKVLDVIIEGGNVADKVAKATSVMTKVMAVVPMADELLRLLSLSPTVLKAEWSDLDAEEKAALKAHVNEKFDIADDDIEAKVELGLALVGEVVDFAAKASAYAKTFKKAG